MKSLLKVAVAGIVCIGLWSAAAQAEVPAVVGHPVPGQLNVQGVLRNALGEPVTGGPYAVTFTLYDAASGGTQLYQEVTPSMTLVGGVFNTFISAPASVFVDRTTVYLGVKINADAELSPRFPVTSVAYAYQAQNAEVSDSTRNVQCLDCVGADEVAFNYAGSSSEGGSATSADGLSPTCNGCVSTTHIGNGTITGADINGTTSISTTGTISAAQFIDQASPTYLVDPAGTSNLLNVNADVITYGTSVKWASNAAVGLFGDDFASDTLNNILSGGVLRIGGGANSVCGSVEVFGLNCGTTRTMTVIGDSAATKFKDRNNLNYSLTPSGSNYLKTLYMPATLTGAPNDATLNTNTTFLGGSFVVSGTVDGVATNWTLNNQFIGAARAFNADWVDYDNPIYRINPSSTSRFNLAQAQHVRVRNSGSTPSFSGGAACDYCGAGMSQNAGILYLGPDGSSNQYIRFNMGGTERFSFGLNGGGSGTIPNLRTNGNYVVLNSGSATTDRRLILQLDSGGTTEVYGRLNINNEHIYVNHAGGAVVVTGTSGYVYAQRFYDYHSQACYLDPGADSLLTNASFTHVSTIGTLNAQGPTHLRSTTTFWASPLPYADQGVNLGSQYNRFYLAYLAAGYTTVSNRHSKRDIHYLDEADMAKVGDLLAGLKPTTYFYKWEYDQPTGDEEKDMVSHRIVPHYGLILDEMPQFLHMAGGWGINDSVGFLLVAAKYHEDQIRALNRQIGDLEDRIALLEQALVDGGLIK
jgi:hypothetical protein